ncbi:hypothetical protein [Cellulomonas sp. URHB0016]
MNTDSLTTTTQDDTDEESSTWTSFAWSALLFAIAVVPFTPLWDKLANPDAGRTRSGARSRLLASIGPVPVSLVFAGLGVVLLLVAISQVRSNTRDAEASSGDQEG